VCCLKLYFSACMNTVASCAQQSFCCTSSCNASQVWSEHQLLQPPKYFAVVTSAAAMAQTHNGCGTHSFKTVAICLSFRFLDMLGPGLE
jgi:hypothetical protein